MATKTSIMVDDDTWKGFQIFAKSQGRSASKQMEWIMKEALEKKYPGGVPVISDSSKKKSSSKQRKSKE